MAEILKCSRVKGNQAEEHDCDVIFKIENGNMTVSCMRNASGHNYRISLVIVDYLCGKIPRSTERMSSL